MQGSNIVKYLHFTDLSYDIGLSDLLNYLDSNRSCFFYNQIITFKTIENHVLFAKLCIQTMTLAISFNGLHYNLYLGIKHRVKISTFTCSC